MTYRLPSAVEAKTGWRGHAGVVDGRRIVGIQAGTRHRDADNAAALRNIDRARGINCEPRDRAARDCW